MKVFCFLTEVSIEPTHVCCMWIDPVHAVAKMSAPESINSFRMEWRTFNFNSGCQECFKTGMYLCSDSMNLIRSDMFASMCVLVSPVYNNSISGSPESFPLIGISCWITPISPKLAGKYGNFSNRVSIEKNMNTAQWNI